MILQPGDSRHLFLIQPSTEFSIHFALRLFQQYDTTWVIYHMPKRADIETILIIGAGPMS